MARQASSNPADSTAHLCFETDFCPFGLRHSELVISTWVQHFIHHLAPQTALRDRALVQSEASPQVVSEAKDNMAGFVLANGSMSSKQTCEGETQQNQLPNSSRPHMSRFHHN